MGRDQAAVGAPEAGAQGGRRAEDAGAGVRDRGELRLPGPGSYRLSLLANQDEPLRFDGRRFYLRRDVRPTVYVHFRRRDIALGRPWLRRRVELLAPRVGVFPSSVEVRDLGFRWGSVAGRGDPFQLATAAATGSPRRLRHC